MKGSAGLLGRCAAPKSERKQASATAAWRTACLCPMWGLPACRLRPGLAAPRAACQAGICFQTSLMLLLCSTGEQSAQSHTHNIPRLAILCSFLCHGEHKAAAAAAVQHGDAVYAENRIQLRPVLDVFIIVIGLFRRVRVGPVGRGGAGRGDATPCRADAAADASPGQRSDSGSN